MKTIFYSVVKYVIAGHLAPTYGLYFFHEDGSEAHNGDTRAWRPLRAGTPTQALALGAIQDGNQSRRTGSHGDAYSFHPGVAMVVRSSYDAATGEVDARAEALNFPNAWKHEN